MFYAAGQRDRTLLPHDPLKALVAPRPIGWVSSASASGAVNLAPYSFFNLLCDEPPILGFSSSGWKDSVQFISETREFVWNLPTYGLRQQVNATSAPLRRGDSEFEAAGLATAPSRLVKAPRVALVPAALECRLIEIKRLTGLDGAVSDNYLVLGQVVGTYIDDRFIKDGMVDLAAMQPISRAGYSDYAVTEALFQMRRPG